MHRGRRRQGDGATRREQTNRFFRHGAAEREIGDRQIGEQLAEGARVHDRAGKRVLSQGFGLFE
ncbi:MAG: hypothetical protein DMD67_17550, partial [Gemmatimonadetes bacterium]